MVQAILWDFDGTICDTYPAIARAVNQALAQFGAAADLERVIELTSISLDACVRTLAAEHAIPYADLDAVFTVTYRSVQPKNQPPFPGFADFCAWASQHGVQHFMITHRRRESLLRLLATHNLTHYFTHIIAADDGFPKKPAPDALIYILNKYGIMPSNALLVGDRDFDVRAGQAADIPTALFRATFAGLRPTYSFTSYRDFVTTVRPLLV